MLGFRRHRQSRRAERSDGPHASHRYRVETREALIQKYELVALRSDRSGVDDRQRLARVLEELGRDGWRLAGVSGNDFIFRRRT